MNIAIIIPSLSGGGAERVAGYLSKYLERYHNVFIFIEYKKNVVYQYGGTLVEYREAFQGRDCTMSFALPILKKKYNINISISFMEVANICNIISRCNDRVIISERSTYSQMRPRISVIDELVRSYYNYADSIVACSHGVKQSLVQDYEVDSSRISVIYNFVDKETVIALSNKEVDEGFAEFIGNSGYFITVGRLDRAKRQDILISQFARYHELYNRESKLVIIGDGPEKSKLDGLIDELKLGDYIRIQSYSDNPFRYMKRAKAFLFTSDYEGMPNVILEAMTLGIPIISVDCISGPRELILGELDYKIVLPDIKICDRGILVKKAKADCGSFSYAMHWLDENNQQGMEMTQNEIKYMSEYNNEEIFDNWKRIIELDNCNTPYCRIDNTIDCTRYRHIYIYGAGKYGKRIYSEFSHKYKVEAFVCTSVVDIPSEIEDKPVISIKDVNTDDDDTIFLVGVSQKHYNSVVDSIISAGYSHYFFPL